MNGLLTVDMTLDYAARALGAIYSRVQIGEDPIYKWMQLVNDGTILAEDVRRGRSREKEAIERLAKIFSRLLEFIGQFLYLHDVSGGIDVDAKRNPPITVHDFLSLCFRRRSYRILGNAPDSEFVTKWILVKYPKCCGKCGKLPCHCVVEPWVFEERRQDPSPFEKYREEVEKQRRGLKDWEHMSLIGLFQFFRGIYRNSFHDQEAWKVAMHLSEELGEATLELSRLRVLAVAPLGSIVRELDEIFTQAREHIRYKEAEKITDPQVKGAARDTWLRKLEEYQKTWYEEIRGNCAGWLEQWGIRKMPEGIDEDLCCRFFFGEMISEKLKEEIADIASWIVAMSYKLDPVEGDTRVLSNLFKFYTRTVEGVPQNVCAWCGKPVCADGCLIRNSLRDELVQAIVRF